MSTLVRRCLMASEEIWKKIQGFEDYEISSYGNVRSLKFNKVKELSTTPSSDGYSQVNLRKEGKTYHFKVRDLVLNTFIPIDDCISISHSLNKVYTDNRVENLERFTAPEDSKPNWYINKKRIII